jgi:maleylacetoacetate isomerase
MSEFILYSYFRSSASYRVRIALYLKKISFEYRAVHLLENGGEQNSETYSQLNPSREVPTLIHNGRSLGQSLAIIDYLDHIQPSPRLLPQDPYDRAKIIQACEIPNSGVQPLHNLRVTQELERKFNATSDQKNEWTMHWIKYGLDTLECLLKTTAGRYSFGDEVTAADCFLIPHVANALRFHVDLSAYPIITKINKNCLELEAFINSGPNCQPDSPEPTSGRTSP